MKKRGAGNGESRKRRLTELHRYLSTLRNFMLLAHWELSVREGVDDDDSVLEVEVGDTLRHFTVSVGASFWTLTAQDQREYCVHELIHVHLEALEHALIDAVKAHLPDAAYQVALASHRRANEFATDALARACAEKFPLPSSALR